MNPGDLCQIIGTPERRLIAHWSCDQHADGTVTDAYTGAVVGTVDSRAVDAVVVLR